MVWDNKRPRRCLLIIENALMCDPKMFDLAAEGKRCCDQNQLSLIMSKRERDTFLVMISVYTYNQVKDGAHTTSPSLNQSSSISIKPMLLWWKYVLCSRIKYLAIKSCQTNFISIEGKSHRGGPQYLSIIEVFMWVKDKLRRNKCVCVCVRASV